MTSRLGFLLPLAFLTACVANPAQQPLTATGTLVEQNGKFYLQGPNARYHLNAMPQLNYERYLGHQLVIQGEIPSYCHQAWEDSQLGGDAGAVAPNQVDWSDCLEADKVSLLTANGSRLVYDWQEIELRDYHF
ncbi:hypothetical protein Mag101_02960 [Microbulbifer agarilyticus]|uniref:Lipoprotein n=1 Tax=Microbulbifer agarilyticus TaxID=260552 RepID=A0A1Q2M1X4_9GAMM|nr:hypothetical protein [Microbulbifer agarilyticus]AQQ66715.1 hypothetical protein Mag101_02960 [Microbulbifer agarilyticus]